MLNNYIIRDGCWLWQGAIGNDGYGKVKHRNRMEYAHRIIYILEKGININNSIHIHHICKRRNCVNPSHMKAIEAKTHKSLHGKIDVEIGKKIIEDYKTLPAQQIGWKYNLSCSSITDFLRRSGTEVRKMGRNLNSGKKC